MPRSIERLKAAAERQAPLLYALISLPSLRPQQWQGVRHRSGAGESFYLVDILYDQPLLTLKIGGSVCGHKLWVNLVRPLGPYALAATVFSLTSMIRVFVSAP